MNCFGCKYACPPYTMGPSDIQKAEKRGACERCFLFASKRRATPWNFCPNCGEKLPEVVTA